MLNAGVQGAFQDLADNYSHRLALPTEMALNNKTFISYKVTNFIWSQHFVAFEASSTFKAEINGRNVTYIPNEGRRTTSLIPIGQWPVTSSSDQQSHLLQGETTPLQSSLISGNNHLTVQEFDSPVISWTPWCGMRVLPTPLSIMAIPQCWTLRSMGRSTTLRPSLMSGRWRTMSSLSFRHLE